MKSLSLFGLSLLIFASSHAAEFNKIFTSHMVLQRDVPANIYGEGPDGEPVRVTFNGQSATTTVVNGKWKTQLKPMPANRQGGELVMESRSNKQVLEDVLVGEVWVLGGQSNMARSFNAYPNLTEVPRKANHPQMRIALISTGIEPTPEPSDEFNFKSDIPWLPAVYNQSEEAAESLESFSPAGYFFGVQLQEYMDVPVGLIMACRGATAAEAWTPRKTLQADTRLHFHFEADKNLDPDDPNTVRDHTSWLYKGVIHPITDFTIKGVLWYQGESNTRTAEPYRILFPAMIKAWRDAWGQGDFPFIFAQLASYGNYKWDDSELACAITRESQAHALKLPNTGMITLLDAGEYEDIHPQNKQIVGERFFMKAREVAYGENIIASGPVFESASIDRASIIVTFSNVGAGLEMRKVSMQKNNTSRRDLRDDPVEMIHSRDGEIEGFMISGPEENFVPAKAIIIAKNQIRVYNLDLQNPKYVRYGWKNFSLANVYNREGFPAEPFRTDQFELPVEP